MNVYQRYFLESLAYTVVGSVLWILALAHKIHVHPRIAFITVLGGLLLMLHSLYCRYLYLKKIKKSSEAATRSKH